MWRNWFLTSQQEDDLHAEVVELFTRAKDISPSYIIHYASAKVMSDALATRCGVQDWFSCLLNATMQGVPAAAEQPLCRVRRAHVLTVFTAAYATYGFNLPESVNARPDAVAYLLNIRILSPVAPLTGQYSRGGLN